MKLQREFKGLGDGFVGDIVMAVRSYQLRLGREGGLGVLTLALFRHWSSVSKGTREVA